MITVKMSTISPEWPWLRQTPHSTGEWNGYKFHVDQDLKECDYWVVYEGIKEAQETLCPPENTILITAEPCKAHYPPKFIRQFKMLVTFHRDLKHPNVCYTHPGLPWHVGRKVIGERNISFSKDYDELKAMRDFKKDKLVSVICSNKAVYQGHLARLRFIRKLEQNSIAVDIFGRGIRDIEDKWDAISRYKYHIALENSICPDYFTEKLTDAFLAHSYPFYYGCSNIFKYFPKGSLTLIDVNNFEETMKTIRNAIENEYYEKSAAKILAARNLVLDKYNVFPLIAEIINRMTRKKKAEKKLVTIIPSCMYQSICVRAKAKIERTIISFRAKL